MRAVPYATPKISLNFFEIIPFADTIPFLHSSSGIIFLMKTLASFPQLRTASMLFAESYSEHLAIYRSLFTDDDIVLDVGCGPDGSDLQFDGFDIDNSTVSAGVEYNTLNFSESIGYLSLHEVITLLQKYQPRKIVIKDFICVQPVAVQYYNYNFQFFHSQILPILITSGYTARIATFRAHKERYKSLLESCGLEYHEYPQIKNVIGVFTK